MQLVSKDDIDERFNHYLMKTFRKTASLMANSCKSVCILFFVFISQFLSVNRFKFLSFSKKCLFQHFLQVALFANCSLLTQDMAFEYGKNLGMAFQVGINILI